MAVNNALGKWIFLVMRGSLVGVALILSHLRLV